MSIFLFTRGLANTWEGDGQSVTGIGRRLRLDTGTLTPLLKRMENQGLITRKRAATDERKVMVHLAGKGKKLKEKAAAIPREILSKSGLTEKEFSSLKDGISQLIDRMEHA